MLQAKSQTQFDMTMQCSSHYWYTVCRALKFRRLINSAFNRTVTVLMPAIPGHDACVRLTIQFDPTWLLSLTGHLPGSFTIGTVTYLLIDSANLSNR
jgi:hypothetical protein